jgi:RimJ/RimL family protein N-acetyltransferase
MAGIGREVLRGWRRFVVSTIPPKGYGLKTGEEVLVRSAEPEDASGLVDAKRGIVEEGRFTLVEPDEFESSEQDEEKSIRDHAEKPGCIYLVAEVGGQTIGLLEFENGRYRRTAHSGMLSMFVRKEWRDRGVGAALLQALIDWAEESPLVEKITLAVFSTNARAIALYSKLGFEEEGRCPKDMKVAGGTYLDSVLMYRFVG